MQNIVKIAENLWYAFSNYVDYTVVEEKYYYTVGGWKKNEENMRGERKKWVDIGMEGRVDGKK